MIRRLAGIALVLVTVFPGSASAQSPLTKIGFGFYVAGRGLDSGKYAIEVTPAGKVAIRAEKGSAVVEVAPLKSLGRDESVKSPKLVFDLVGSQRFLAQVWLPGQDGLQVGSVSGDHEQVVVGGAAPKK